MNPKLVIVGAVVGVALVVPLLLDIVLRLVGLEPDTKLLAAVFGVATPVIAVGAYVVYLLKSWFWLALHRLPRDKEAMRAVARLRPRWNDKHPGLTLAARRYAYRRADSEQPSFVAAGWVAKAYADAGGRDANELFELMRAFHPYPGAMSTARAAIARVVGLRAIVANLRAGTSVGTMVRYIDYYGVKTLEEGLVAGIPFEHMEVMR